MLSNEAQAIAIRAKKLYATRLRETLEQSHLGEYVCIEPESGDFFIGATFDSAVNQAIDAHPDCLTHTMRIGHATALHLGVLIQ